MDEREPEPPESLLPYDVWTEEALRHVMVRALTYAAENGLPGEHHFYLTFRTDLPTASMPKRLRAQYPQEMTIVLQHQFWDLAVDEAAGTLRVALSFGGVPTICTFRSRRSRRSPTRMWLRPAVSRRGAAAPRAEPAPEPEPEAAPPNRRPKNHETPAGGQPRFVPPPRRRRKSRNTP